MAATARSVLSCLLLVSWGLCALGDSCGRPEVQASSYTTQDATVLTNIAYVAEFTLKCSNPVKGLPLYAEVQGKIFPAARTADDNRYQEGYAALRKALRSGEEAASVKPLAALILNHPGAYQGPWVNSEFMAAALAVVL
ncbi:hypothetical protein B566_EDAN014783 [Ephemera danica]|nr:hypothetical protein B566_EDAN014783 [Ephemera danica]